MMANGKQGDGLFEAMLRQAAAENLDQEIQALLDDQDKPSIDVSQRHADRMRELFATDLRQKKKASWNWTRRVAAAVILAVVTFSGIMVFSSEARAFVSRTFVHWFDQYALFNTNNPADEPSPFLIPSYIPGGYSQTEHMDMEIMLVILYENQDGGMISFVAQKAHGATAVGTTDRTHEVRRIGGIEYHLFIPASDELEIALVWETGGNRYNIVAPLSADTLLEMARSVR